MSQHKINSTYHNGINICFGMFSTFRNSKNSSSSILCTCGNHVCVSCIPKHMREYYDHTLRHFRVFHIFL